MIREEIWDKVKEKLWGDSFWSNGYFYEAVGRITSETAKFYIECQQGKHWEQLDYDYYRSKIKDSTQKTLMDFAS
jgi:REP element-mobilizing transposase RayT